ncbi:hypothetical protein ACFV23_55910, partial [Streptomyces sp. NPDC059627]
LPPGQRAALLGAFGMTDLPAQADPVRIGLAALELLSDSAARRPLLAVVDDLQWVDPASREVIGFVSRRLSAEPVVLLVATREAPPRTGRPGDGSGPLHLPLAPLDASDAGALLTRRAPALSEIHREQVLDTARGNPLALLELSASALAGPQRQDALPLTDRLRYAFADRLEECPPAARAVLLIAAVQDSDCRAETERAAHVLLRRPVLAGDWSEAARSGLVEIDDGTVRFRHPLMCSAVVDSSTPQSVSAAHRALAGVLAADPDRATWHHACALHEPDPAVADALEASADRALSRGAPGLAQTLLERSAQLSREQAVGGHRLLRAAEVAFELGRPDTVRVLLEQVRAQPLPPADSGRLSALDTVFDDGVPGGAGLVRRLRQGAADAVRAGDGELAAGLLIRAARACYWGAVRDPELLGRLRSVADELCLAPGDPRPVLVDAFLSPFARGTSIVGHLDRWATASEGDPGLTGLLAMAGFVSGSFEHTVPLTLRAETG